MKKQKSNLHFLLASFFALALILVLSSTATVQAQVVVVGSYTHSFKAPWVNGWTNPGGDDFDWVKNIGSTPSAGTGPNSAYHGTGYIYAEASSPNNPGKVANLVSPAFNLTNLNSPRVTYKIHMNGSDMGTLWMDISTNGGFSWTAYQITAGAQGTGWKSIFANIGTVIGSGTNVKFRFRAITGSGFRSDIALDYFQLTDIAPRLAADDDATAISEELEDEAAVGSSYPNPFQNELTVKIPEQNDIVSLRLYDIQGKLVIEKEVYTNGQPLNLDTHDVIPGTYILRISSKEFNQTLRVVRQ